MKRSGLSKSIRFEVFKRDKFTCHYCGRKAPDVVLHVDHIEPVSKGGGNDIINLITSCYECNLGKSDKKLSDNTVVEKQRKQLELLQERREQIELMFEWKKSLSKLDDETVDMITEYAEAKIKPFTLNENGKNKLKDLLRRYGIDELLNAIDVSATTYLKCNEKGELDQGSIEKFLDKLGGIAHNRRLSPIDQKLALIKNKARIGFNYYNPRGGAILLNQYVNALRTYWHYNDEQILKDLDFELLPKLEETNNWTAWHELLEGWIESIKKPQEQSLRAEMPKDHTQEEMDGYIQGRINTLREAVVILNHLLEPYPNYNRQKFEKALYKAIADFIEKQKELSPDTLKQYKDENERKMFIWDFNNTDTLKNFWGYDYAGMLERVDENKENGDKLHLLMGLENVISAQLDTLFDEQFYFGADSYSSHDLPIIRDMAIKSLANNQ